MKIGFTSTNAYKKLAIASVIVSSTLSAHAQLTTPTGPMAKPPYTVTVFAAPPQGLTNPDSITTANENIYVVYPNNTQPDGTGGTSTIFEINHTGQKRQQFKVKRKAGGLKYKPL